MFYESRFVDANLFEGMTSLRAVIHAMENGISDRKILRVIVDQDKRKSRARELAWLGYKAKEMKINDNHIASCWHNIKDAIAAGELTEKEVEEMYNNE